MAERFINAAKDGYLDILREGTKRDLNTADDNGMTATLWAAHSGNLEALRLIVGRKGDIDKADYLGKTALLHAVSNGHMSVVSFLVHWGCNLYALDNDLHSALDLAYLYERHEIVRFLDAQLAEKQAKNPKHVTEMKEEAMRVAEQNIKRYEKLTAQAAKKLDKESRRQKMEREHQIKVQNGITETDTKPKSGFFKALTIRLKGGPNPNNSFDSTGTRKSSYSGSSISGINKKIHAKGLESLTSRQTYSRGRDFEDGTIKSIYVAGDFRSKKGELIYRTKSESDLLDSGTDTYLEDQEDEENNGGILNKTGFGRIAFLPQNSFVSTAHSFDDSGVPSSPSEVNGKRKPFSEMDEEEIKSKENNVMSQLPLPWDQDDVDNLDDDEEREINELSSVSMFLESCGLAGYLHIFLKEKIDLQVLTRLTDSDLKELALPLGPKKKLLEAIARRKALLETPRRMVDTYL